MQSFSVPVKTSEVALQLAGYEDAKDKCQARLVFACDAVGRTFVQRQFVTYPFHICRVFYAPKDPVGLASLYVQSTGGGVFENDRLGMSIVLGENAKAHVTTAASTIAHTMEKGDAQQEIFIEAGPGAFLEYLPDPLILFPQARMTSRLKIKVDPTATVIFCESFITHDPRNCGEIFDQLHTDTCIERSGGGILVRDRSVLTGKTFIGEAPGVNSKYKAQGTFMVIDQKTPHEKLVSTLRTGLESIPGVYFGASSLPSDAGAWVRILAIDGAALKAGINAAWGVVRELMTGTAPLSRRK